MNPIVVAYPRSGSEILTDIVFNYASQLWKSERCLQEFLLITFFRDNNFEFINNKIEGMYWSLSKDQWPSHWNKIKDTVSSTVDQRISWLTKNPNYVFKLITNPRVTDNQYKWCIENFHCVFVERRDKIRSFLSYLFLPYIGTHHRIDSDAITKEKLKIKMNIDLANQWIWNYKKFNELSAQSTNKSLLVYEDIMTDHGVDEEKILQILNWPIPSNYQFYKFKTKPTPYEDNDLLNYFEDKESILAYIKVNSDVFD
jgi:hypothetical protein